MEAVDVQGFAGGFTCGVVQAGWDLVAKRELPGGFGVPACEANRHILGEKFETEVGPWHEWTPVNVPFVFGNPPCSGFSLMSASHFRGPDSPINNCMKALIEYAARCDPEIVMFESVQQAYSQGRELMQRLRDLLEVRTDRLYTLVHILQQGYNLGGPAWRPRFFACFTRIPFGVERPDVTNQPLWGDLIGDLASQPLEWQPRQYVNVQKIHPWVKREVRTGRSTFVDGHDTWSHTQPLWERLRDLNEMLNGEWPENMTIQVALREVYRRHGRLPDSFSRVQDKMVANDFASGFHQPNRWRTDRPCRVMTGAAGSLVIHPWSFRPLTGREVLRGQGFPDDWRVSELPNNSKTSMYWGKGIPVQVGRWAATWARQSIEGAPGRVIGRPIGPRERLIDVQRPV